MNSPILEALPALHVTIIGVVAAFFSAFAIYAYQKLNDAKEKLDEALKHCMLISNPHITMQRSNNIYLNEDGSLNWDEHGKDAIWKAKVLYSYLDREEKYNIPRDHYQREPSQDEVIAACNELFLLFTTIFTTYPFWNNEKVSKLRSTEFDSERVQLMQRIVNYLCWTWDTSKRSLLTLASKGNEYSKQQELKRIAQMHEEMIASMPVGSLTEEEKQMIMPPGYNYNLSVGIDFSDVFVSYFEMAHVVQKEIIPLLSKLTSSFNTYNETFRVKETSLTVITLITFNMLFGVLLPLIILNLFAGFQFKEYSFWFSFFEYLILLSTMYPYLWACNFLHSKVKNLNFF